MENGNGIHAEGANGDVALNQNLEPIDKRKVFVGGLGPDTNEDDLKNYFGQFGAVCHAVVKRDPATGRSRCFAFVTFETSAAVKAVAAVSVHTVKGKKIDPKPAEPRPGEEPCVKIFVGGIDPAMSEEELKEFFLKYGNVKNIEWPKDRMRDNAKKNFAFIEFDNDTVVAEIIKTPKMTIGGRLCDVRKAIPPQQKPPGQGFGGAAFGGYGDPYGGYGGYGGGYGAAAAAGGGYGDQYASYYQGGGYDQSGYYGADPNAAAAAGYAGYAGYDQAYAGYDYSGAGAAAAGGYGGAYGADGTGATYASRGARGAPRGRGGPMVGARGASAPGGAAGARGGVRGYHPYRRP